MMEKKAQHIAAGEIAKATSVWRVGLPRVRHGLTTVSPRSQKVAQWHGCAMVSQGKVRHNSWQAQRFRKAKYRFGGRRFRKVGYRFRGGGAL